MSTEICSIWLRLIERKISQAQNSNRDLRHMITIDRAQNFSRDLWHNNIIIRLTERKILAEIWRHWFDWHLTERKISQTQNFNRCLWHMIRLTERKISHGVNYMAPQAPKKRCMFLAKGWGTGRSLDWSLLTSVIWTLWDALSQVAQQR